MAKRKASKPLGVGVIGCGLMGSIHAQAYADAKGCELRGLQNRSRDKAEALAKQFGGKVYDTVDQLLADPAIDAVSICTVQSQHAEQIIAAAKAGKHILAEKPLALTAAEMDAIERAINKAGVTLMVGHQLRFHPALIAARKAMSKLGKVYHLDLEMCFRIDADAGRCWASYREGGFFMELGVHLADLAAWIMGDIHHVTGHTLRMNPRRVTEDYTHCLLQHQSNAVSSIIVSANHRTTRQGLLMGRILGEKGRIDLNVYPYQRAMNNATLVLDQGKSVFVPDEKKTKLTWRDRPSLFKTYPGFFDVYQQQNQAFVDAVRQGSEPPITFAAGRSAVEVVLACYDAQGAATTKPNFTSRKSRYRSDAASHPALDS